eukprot:NODE_1889_length_721_cov_241.653274_g1394_i1.p5 GENE.NODE_1889_length_721_cov_241.653274_g1394_i1~~NODE_1889_length_721_cov_241.653274_g1394_i1.p5  ORF type:complete len:63 (+),score=7.32 NODE_1889_length_721_cov_241.653274_g1394_i1:324-512(+)
MVVLRRITDELEGLVPRSLWPFPTYSDMLFSGQLYDVSVAPEGKGAGVSTIAPSQGKLGYRA